MKNIYLIITGKPSRLIKDFNSKLLVNYNNVQSLRDGYEYQNIYITNSEEIKEGVDQWYLDKVLNEPYNSGGAQYASKQDVIILTTDQDLIKDGVQPIDDVFLEWFVKNPSCEEVEVKVELYPCLGNGSEIIYSQPANLGGSEDRRNNINTYINQEHTDNRNFIKAFDKKRYKIIIPKEESIQDVCCGRCNGVDDILICSIDFINGTEYQAKRSYNEQEVLQLIQYLKDYTRESEIVLGYDEREPIEFLEIFKTKLKKK